ncbi:matrin-3-like [Oncorhynchus nerka]|uniref:matrin-3-like n=1 Tax=Oncorhynchus nerka TaxID=8023 RepID=UPI0031B7FB02
MIQELSATGSEQGEKRDGEDQKADASYVDEEEHDFPEGHENHITLGALKQDSSADGQDNQSIYEPRRRSKRKPSGRDQTPGRVIYVKNLPRGFYTDNDFLKIVKGFGRVHRYYLHGNGEEGFIEMERSSDATKALRELRYDGCKLYGQRVTILRSQKYKRLITGWKPESDSDSESDQKKDHRNSRSSSRIRRWISSHSKSAAKDKETKEEDEETKEEDKETKEEDEETKEEDEETKEEDEETKEEDEETKEEDEETKEEDEETKEEDEETKEEDEETARQVHSEQRSKQSSDPAKHFHMDRGASKLNTDKFSNSEDQNNAPVSAAEDEKRACSTEDNVETKMEDNVERGPDYVKTGMESSFQPNNPVGREFITPVMGYFCNLCQVAYVNEDEAKNQHCSSLCHYLKFMEHSAKDTASS